jgi:hypothetical protein
MLQCIVNITLTQQPKNNNGRDKVFNLSFCHSFEVYSSWKDLSDTATVEVPKNVYVTDQNGNQVLWGDSTTQGKVKGYVNAGGFNSANAQVSSTPLIMRGDSIVIKAGYSYISQVNADGSLNYNTQLNTVFTGYISSLESKNTLKLHCEDNMWLLKQTNMQAKTYAAPNNDISNVLNDIVAQVQSVFPNSNLSANTNNFTLGVDGFKTGNETAAETLNKLKKILPSMGFYFRNNVLRGGGSVYYYSDQSLGTGPDGEPLYNTFNFQKNIITDEMHYSLMSDVKVGAQCYSVTSTQGTKKNKMGTPQYTTDRYDATVGVQNGDDADGYEYYTFYFKDVTSTKTLTAKGATYLARYQYDGFRGNFTTFGMPFVQHGNIIYITDNLYPERNGHYMVKAVHYSFGLDSGLRQEIDLHFRTDNIDQSVLQQGM